MTKGPINTKVSGDISEKAATYLSNTFRTKHAGLLYVLEVVPALHQYCVKALKGAFTINELCLIVEAFWDQYLQPEMAGEQLKAKVEKAIVLGKKDEKWGVQPKKLMAKISSLPLSRSDFSGNLGGPVLVERVYGYTRLRSKPLPGGENKFMPRNIHSSPK